MFRVVDCLVSTISAVLPLHDIITTIESYCLFLQRVNWMGGSLLDNLRFFFAHQRFYNGNNTDVAWKVKRGEVWRLSWTDKILYGFRKIVRTHAGKDSLRLNTQNCLGGNTYFVERKKPFIRKIINIIIYSASTWR